jgi:hypothetical protein
MINAPTGFIPYVSGNKIAVVVIGPIPGRTPMRVPIKHPIRQNARF